MPAFSSAGPLDEWTWRNPLPQGNNLNAITYGNGLFVAVGDNGTILTSPDGTTWTSRTSGTTSKIYSVTYNGTNLFVAAVDGNKVATSSNGIDWAVSNTGMSCQFYALAFGEGIFVAVGSDSCGQYYYTSANGLVWTYHSPQQPTGGILYGIAYGDTAGKFVAIGESGSRNEYDGVDTWTHGTSGADNLYGVAFGNNTFVSVGGTSKAVAFGNGVFVVVGQSGLTKRFADNSWSTVSGAWTQPNELKGVAYGNGRFVAVGAAGTILVSLNDGVTWEIKSSGSSKTLYAVTYGTPAGSGLFVAVGEAGAIVTSANGTLWTSRTSNTVNTLYGVAYGTPGGNGLFVAGGFNGTIVTSPDGIIWTVRDSGTFDDLKGFSYSNGVFVAVGGMVINHCKTMKSTDGITWTDTGCSGTISVLNSVTYGNSSFVANGGPVYRSTDNGSSWSSIAASSPSQGITYGFGKFIAVGYNYAISYSSDGSSWTIALSSFSGPDFASVTYANGSFVAVGESGMIYTSSTGASWTTRTSGTSNGLYGVTFGDGKFLAVGIGGTILQSGAVSAPQISVTSPVAIGNVNVGVSDSAGVTISNQGGSDLLVSAISISGNNPDMFGVELGGGNACASLTPTIAAGGNCTLLVSFTPSSSGAKSAVLNITSNAAEAPATSNLSGTGKSTLSVTKTGSGTITSVPAAIDCGITCSAQFNPDQNITLSTSAGAGYYFSSWGGACAGAGGCAFNMNTDRTVSATFSQCTYSLESASTSIASAGGAGNISLTTLCAWTAAKDAEWITITSGGSGSGNGTVGYTVAANNGPARTGTINVSGQVFTINQASGCAYVIDPSSSSYSSVAGSGNLSVTASNGNCAWTASSNNLWITVTSGGSATGSAQIGYSISANTVSTARTGTMTAAGQTFTVNQSGVTCAYSMSETGHSFSAAVSTGTVDITVAASDCQWTSTSNAQWITITSGGSGTGNGAVGYSVTQNTGKSARNGTLTIAGHTYTVSQAGVGCTYSISPADKTFNNAAGSGSISVTASANDCSWSVSVSDPWITISSGDGGSGNGTVEYAIVVNTNSAPRQGTVTIANKTFSINQTGVDCAYSLSSPSQEFTDAGGNGSVDVTASAGDCAWTATSNNPWISIVSGGSSTGSATVTYSVAENSGSDSRSGTLTIAGQAYGVTQEGNPDVVAQQYTITINSTGTGSGTVTSDTGTLTCDSGTCTGTYDSGAQITLTAGADEGSKFAGWSGEGCEGNDTCILTISADITVVAQFTLSNQVALSVSKAGSGSGSIKFSSKGDICGTDCYIYGLTLKRPKKIVVTAKSLAGSKFISWSGDYEGTKASLTAVMNEDRTITAYFGKPGISVPEDTIDFGSVAKKQTAFQTLTLENNGDAPLRVGLKVVGQGAGMFRLFNGDNDRPISSYTVPSGGSLQVIIKFRPTATGLRSVKLQILSDDAEKPKVEVPLTATGTAAPSK